MSRVTNPPPPPKPSALHHSQNNSFPNGDQCPSSHLNYSTTILDPSSLRGQAAPGLTLRSCSCLHASVERTISEEGAVQDPKIAIQNPKDTSVKVYVCVSWFLFVRLPGGSPASTTTPDLRISASASRHCSPSPPLSFLFTVSRRYEYQSMPPDSTSFWAGTLSYTCFTVRGFLPGFTSDCALPSRCPSLVSPSRRSRYPFKHPLPNR
ncbi:hypothetical protein NMY22_g15956 [Coprinellus aureogranulatus]|nr:hypothetical protein NMY22_g15956 [Coprinellus aureogranulatus]